MKLNFEQIKRITTGAVEFECDESGVSFHRFTKAQRDSYKERYDVFYRNNFSTSGIKLCFRTDSENLYLKISTDRGSSRRYFSLDVFSDGKCIGNIDNFSDAEVPKNYHAMPGDMGEFSKNFFLGGGVKNICVHFPWSVYTKLIDIELDDGAFIEAVKPSKKLVAFGDSITQGYDALRPSSRYTAKLSDALDAEEINKGIGGERFWAKLPELKDDFSPDYITVAYGTNDWRYAGDGFTKGHEYFEENCNLFFENLRMNYPDAKIFAITPLWRIDVDNPQTDWRFDETEKMIRYAAKPRNVSVIRGVELLPHDTNLFGDLVLHPNDEGFRFYFENLYNAIKNCL